MPRFVASSPLSVGGLRIGLVEDSDTDAYALRRAFSRLGHVQRWPDGEAFRAAATADLDLVAGLDLLLVDLNLLGLDGIGVARVARTAPGGSRLPSVMLTGSVADYDRLRARHAAITAYEVKPRRAAELHAVVARCSALVAQLATRAD